MLFVFILMVLMVTLVDGEEYTGNKPYIVVPVPLEFPNRNDRSEQCWLRIEDIEIIETISVYCYVAQEFLHKYIQDYNSRKIIEDRVDVTPWDDKPNRSNKPFSKDKNQNGKTSWKMVTILDPITDDRLYVTKNADCKLVMYSREGMTSYKVECQKILYYFNINSGVTSLGCVRELNSFIIVVCFFINIIILLL